jgi:uncharacterized protein (DUF1810 family)
MPDSSDPYNLKRFVKAQADIFEQVWAELRDGEKQSHWIWFIFPQIQGLGTSSMARKFAIASRTEAEAYLRHPLLGTRLRKCTALIYAVQGRTIEQILHAPDDMKFRSSLTLFAHATSDNSIFLDALKKYFSGAFDPRTLEQLERSGL